MRHLIFPAVTLMLACQSSNSKQSASSDQPASPDEQVADRMLDHFIALTALERAVVEGNLTDARTHAAALARPRLGDPAAWASRVSELQSAARLATKETELSRAAARVIEVLAACAGCHRELGVDLRPITIPEAPAGETVVAKMLRHQWGLDLLRLALVFDNSDVWQRGSDVLTVAPLHPSELAESGIINPDVVGHANKLRQLASGAKNLEQSGRFGFYGELLQTCVGCHAE